MCHCAVKLLKVEQDLALVNNSDNTVYLFFFFPKGQVLYTTTPYIISIKIWLFKISVLRVYLFGNFLACRKTGYNKVFLQKMCLNSVQ